MNSDQLADALIETCAKRLQKAERRYKKLRGKLLELHILLTTLQRLSQEDENVSAKHTKLTKRVNAAKQELIWARESHEVALDIKKSLGEYPHVDRLVADFNQSFPPLSD